MDPLATAFRSVGGSREALAILQRVGVATLDVVRLSSDSPAEFAVAIMHMAAQQHLPTPSAHDEERFRALYRVAVGSDGVKAAAFATANPSILSPFGPAPSFNVSLRPPTKTQR